MHSLKFTDDIVLIRIFLMIFFALVILLDIIVILRIMVLDQRIPDCGSQRLTLHGPPGIERLERTSPAHTPLRHQPQTSDDQS